MQLQHYGRVIWSRIRLIILGTLLCAIATYAVSASILPTYEASALIQVNGTGTNDSSGVFANQSLAVSYAIQVTNNDVLQAVAQQLPGVTVSQLQTEVSASPLNSTQIIQVRADTHNPAQAARIANTVVNAFIQNQTTTQTKQLQSLADQLNLQIANADTQLNDAQARLTSLLNSQAPAAQITQQKETINTYQTNYNSLITNLNQVQLQQSLVSNQLTVVQSATAPTQPLSSRKLLNTALAAVLAFLLLIALALLLDWTDATVKTPEDVAQLALLEPLGSVPLLRGSPHFVTGNEDGVEESFITIATSFDALNKDRRAILVTGLHANAGASTTAAQLARELAQSGKRILLIDANLRHPSLFEIFGRPNVEGLATSLAEENMSQGYVRDIEAWLEQWKTKTPNLWLIPAGRNSSHASRLLRGAELRTLVSSLLQPKRLSSGQDAVSIVDMIIFDAPALVESADAIALAALTDGSILVVAAGKEKGEDVKKAQATLKRLGSPVLGVVVNRQQAKHRSYIYADLFRQKQLAEKSTDNTEPKYPFTKTQAFPVRAVPETPAPVVPAVSTTPVTSGLQPYDIPTSPLEGDDDENAQTVVIATGPLKAAKQAASAIAAGSGVNGANGAKSTGSVNNTNGSNGTSSMNGKTNDNNTNNTHGTNGTEKHDE